MLEVRLLLPTPLFLVCRYLRVGNPSESRNAAPVGQPTNRVNQNRPTHPQSSKSQDTATQGHTYPPAFHSPKKRTRQRLQRARRHPHRRTACLPRLRSIHRCKDRLSLIWIHDDRPHAKTSTAARTLQHVVFKGPSVQDRPRHSTTRCVQQVHVGHLRRLGPRDGACHRRPERTDQDVREAVL